MWKACPPGGNLSFSQSRREFVGCRISDNGPKKEGLNINAARFPLLSQRRRNSEKFRMIYGLSPVNGAFCNKQDGRFEKANGHSYNICF